MRLSRDMLFSLAVFFLFSLGSLFSSVATMWPKTYQYLTGLLTVQVALGSPLPKHEANHLGAVASEAEICSHIGTELLKKGGNAADAMVGTVACVGVVGMYHSGKFGRFFYSIRGWAERDVR